MCCCGPSPYWRMYMYSKLCKADFQLLQIHTR